MLPAGCVKFSFPSSSSMSRMEKPYASRRRLSIQMLICRWSPPWSVSVPTPGICFRSSTMRLSIRSYRSG